MTTTRIFVLCCSLSSLLLKTYYSASTGDFKSASFAHSNVLCSSIMISLSLLKLVNLKTRQSPIDTCTCSMTKNFNGCAVLIPPSNAFRQDDQHLLHHVLMLPWIRRALYVLLDILITWVDLASHVEQMISRWVLEFTWESMHSPQCSNLVCTWVSWTQHLRFYVSTEKRVRRAYGGATAWEVAEFEYTRYSSLHITVVTFDCEINLCVHQIGAAVHLVPHFQLSHIKIVLCHPWKTRIFTNDPDSISTVMMFDASETRRWGVQNDNGYGLEEVSIFPQLECLSARLAWCRRQANGTRWI